METRCSRLYVSEVSHPRHLQSHLSLGECTERSLGTFSFKFVCLRSRSSFLYFWDYVTPTHAPPNTRPTQLHARAPPILATPTYQLKPRPRYSMLNRVSLLSLQKAAIYGAVLSAIGSSVFYYLTQSNLM